MSIQETKPGRYVVQIFKSDPLGEAPLRLCKRVAGKPEAEKQEKAFESESNEWAAKRDLIKQAQARGIPLAAPPTKPNSNGFATYLEETYLPWAKTNLDPSTMRARAPSIMILAQDLGNTPLHQIENEIDDLIAKWRSEGCRYREKDKLGRPTNRQPRPISDAGMNERLKTLRAIVGHAHMRSKVLATPPRIPLLTKKRAAPGASTPVRYFEPDERARFLRYARPDMADVFTVGCLLGTRPSELWHLKVGDVDLKRRKVTVQATSCPLCPGGRWVPKTGFYRSVDVCPDLLPILRRLLKDKPDDALLIDNRHGAPYSRLGSGGGQLNKTLRRAGLDRRGLSAYSLRHTFAADLITAGRPIAEVAALLGNSSRVCALHYAHLIPGKTAEAVKSLKAIEPWPTIKKAVTTEDDATQTTALDASDSITAARPSG